MKKIFVLLLGSLIIQYSSAQVMINTEIKDLATKAFAHFPKIKEAENSILLAEEKAKLVELNRQPDVTGDAGYSYVRPKIELPINGTKFQFAPLNNVTANLNGSYTLLDFGRLKAAITQSKNELKMATHGKELIQHQLAYQTAAICYQIVYLQKAIGIQDTLINILEENSKMAESLFKNGTALEIDVMGIRSSIDEETNRKTELISQLNKQLILLEFATGTSVFSGTAFDITIQSDANANSSHPELLIGQDRWEQAKQDLSLAQLKNRPVVGLRASMGTRNGYLPNIADLRFNYVAGLNFSVPLYNGGKLKQQIKIQERFATQQSLALESLQQNIQKDIKQVQVDLASSKIRMPRADSQIEVARRSVSLAYSRLKNGTGTHLEVSGANGMLQKALLNKLQLEYQDCMAQLEYARLLGWKFW
jgi:outer membrane protein TolC